LDNNVTPLVGSGCATVTLLPDCTGCDGCRDRGRKSLPESKRAA